MTTDPQAAEREHAPVPVPNVTVEGVLYGRVAFSSAWWQQRRPDMERIITLPDTWHLLDRILEQDAELVKLRAEVARLQALGGMSVGPYSDRENYTNRLLRDRIAALQTEVERLQARTTDLEQQLVVALYAAHDAGGDDGKA